MKRMLTVCISCLLMSLVLIAEAEDTAPAPTTTPGMGPGPGPGMGRGMGRNMPTFEEFDLDGSGYLDEKEFIEARTKRISARAQEGRMMRGLSNMMEFKDFDQDGDGKVMPDEFAQGMAAHRQEKMQQMPIILQKEFVRLFKAIPVSFYLIIPAIPSTAGTGTICEPLECLIQNPSG